MVKKHLIPVVLPFLISINSNAMVSLPRLLYYGLGVYTCFRAMSSAERNTKIENLVPFFLLTCTITYYDYAKYQRFLSAPDEIKEAYTTLNNRISNILEKVVDKEEKNKKICSALYVFEASLMRNNPEYLDSPPIVEGINSVYNPQNKDILTSNDYSIEYDNLNGYRFTDQNRIIDEGKAVIYKPIERKRQALDLLPTPTERCKKQLQETGICLGFPFAWLAISTAIDFQKNR